jgi:preprotein translocase subunit SecA
MGQSVESAQLDSLVRRVQGLGSEMVQRSDAELRGLRDDLGRRLIDGQLSELTIAEAFAGVREVSRRTTGRSYKDSEIVAGAALHYGRAVEIEDDGYNAFVAVLPIYLSVLLNERVRYVTTTAALAVRNFQEVQGLCAMLGVRTGLISGTAVSVEDVRPVSDADVTYGSYQKFILEYLGDHLALDSLEPVGSRPRVAIVDQIDSILIDQENLPLVIRAPKSANADLYHKIAVAASELKHGRHFEIDAASGMVSFSGDGLTLGASLLRVDTLEGLQGAALKRYLEDALRARAWYRRGRDYHVAGGKVVLKRDRDSKLERAPRLREGVLQAIEAMEGSAITSEEVVWARMTVSDHFRTYSKLCGMSGVVARSSSELERVYGLDTTIIPAVRSSNRIEYPELVYETALTRFEALVQDTVERHRVSQPVVIGVGTAADVNLVGGMLKRRKIEYVALLPGDDENAAEVTDQAGQPGAVTVVAAGVARGCDVTLGRYSPSKASSESTSQVGLAVLVAGRSRSWRWDQWLSTLAGRRGEPGEIQFFLSLEDPLLRGLQSQVWGSVPSRVRKRADAAPLGAIRGHIINEIQRKTEQAESEWRLHQFAVNKVESTQRAQFYSLHEKLLDEKSIANYVRILVEEVVAMYVMRYRDPDQLLSALARLYSTQLTVEDLLAAAGKAQPGRPLAGLEETTIADAHFAYERHERFLGTDAMRGAERQIIVSVLNSNWRQHLFDLDAMRAAANLDASPRGQLSEYRNEAAKQYVKMCARINEDIVGYLFHSRPEA